VETASSELSFGSGRPFLRARTILAVRPITPRPARPGREHPHPTLLRNSDSASHGPTARVSRVAYLLCGDPAVPAGPTPTTPFTRPGPIRVRCTSRLTSLRAGDASAPTGHRPRTTEALTRQRPRPGNTWSRPAAHVSKLGHLLVGSRRGRTAPFVFAAPTGVTVGGPRSRGARCGAVASSRSRGWRPLGR